MGQDQAAATDQDVTRGDTILVQDQDTIRDAPDQDVIARVDIIPDLDTILGLDTTQDLVVQEEDAVILDLDTTQDLDTTLVPDITTEEHLWEEFSAGPLDRVDPVTQDSQTRPAAESTLAINNSLH